MSTSRQPYDTGPFQPEISIVIPVWNGEEHLPLCLDALTNQTLADQYYEIIVVDNGSTDQTTRLLERYPHVRVLVEPNPGSYRARNTGLKAVRGAWVAFTDADCIPARDWVERVLDATRAHPHAGIIAGRVELFRPDGRSSATCAAYEQLFTLNQEAYAASGHCATANWASPVSVISKAGNFDGELKSGGDFELARRIGAAGLPVVYCPQAVVFHPTRSSVRGVLRKRLRVHGGRWAMRDPGLSNAAFAIQTAKDGLWYAVLASRAEHLDRWMKGRLIALIAVLTAGSLVEHARLLLGGAARRA